MPCALLRWKEESRGLGRGSQGLTNRGQERAVGGENDAKKGVPPASTLAFGHPPPLAAPEPQGPARSRGG